MRGLGTLGGLALLAAAAGCSSHNPQFSGGDMGRRGDAGALSPLGGACTADSDCAGSQPVCWRTTFANKPGRIQTPGGYCSQRCSTNANCGAGGSCVDFGSEDGKWCLARCQAASDCRSPGYACFVPELACFSDGNLDCDPQAGDGSCQTHGVPGGCVRAALGTGPKTGMCTQSCYVGLHTCPPNFSGDPQVCLVEDETRLDSGTASGDKWKGPICLNFAATQHRVGEECAVGTGHFTNACIDGAECYLNSGVFQPRGDNVCYQLCYLAPPPTDRGIPIPTGGMVAGPCAPIGGRPTICTDVFGLFSADPVKRIGLCR